MIEPTKFCKRCAQAKPLEAFGINRSAKDGRIVNCRACEVARVREWRIGNPAKVAAWHEKNRTQNVRDTLPPDTTRKCTICKETKKIAFFGRDSNQKDNIRLQCKMCTLARAAQYYEANPEKMRAKTAAWRKANPERDLAYRKQYQTANADRRNEGRRQWRIAHIDHEREKDKAWLRNNRAKAYAKNARRRAAEERATPQWLTPQQKAEIERLYERAIALSEESGVKHHVDHIVPLRGKHVSGLHVPWNLQVITAEENAKKYNKFSQPEYSRVIV